MQNQDILVVNEKTGRIMKGMRIQLNCSQAEFGGKIGIKQPTVAAIEAGRLQPSIQMVEKLANRFGLDPKCITGQEPMVWAALA